ncbi:DUF4328 domain-containing protein [Promicromonospora sp. NPDC060204]|uniref:DUF4328 domain-containing protein n=1 Tax=Promicromonospora sp. NPDC060204 TaxID=3347071 RepID=UPI003662A2AF
MPAASPVSGAGYGPPLHQAYGPPPQLLPPLRSTAGPGMAAIVLACAWTATRVLSLLLAPQGAQAMERAAEAGKAAIDSEFTAYDGMGVLSVVVQIAAFIVTAIWLYQSRSTAVAANPTFIHKRGPVWAWLGWWVPVVSFWFPFQVVRDVRRATSPRPVSEIGAWWGTWLVFLSVSNLVGRLTAAGNPGSAQSAADVMVPMEAVATVAMIVSLFLWIRIIRDITRAQRERIAAGSGYGS